MAKKGPIEPIGALLRFGGAALGMAIGRVLGWLVGWL
jgi:hypothetical protein